ncbi:MAG: arsenic transport integral membrane protein ArsB [Candidatus Dormibacteria bacterium]
MGRSPWGTLWPVSRPSLAAAVALTGTLALLLAVAGAPHTALIAATAAWPPFVLVAGLLLIGFVAHRDGLFDLLAAGLDRLPGGPAVLYLGALGLVAAVTVVLNLDTSVAFLTPILVLAARRRNAPEAPFLYGCVFMSNAASLLLPGSNLTNLLVLATDPVAGGVFAARMAPGWLAAVVVTGGVTWLLLRGDGVSGTPARATPAAGRPWVSLAATAAAAVAILALPHPALVVGGLGLAILATAVGRGLPPRAALGAVDLRTLAGLLGIAIGLGTLARSWDGPAQVLAGAGRTETALLGVVAAILVNNLPAAVLLGSRHPAHARALLLGLNLGPNLAATGSLSAVLWWTTARRVRAHPSLRTYSLVGALLVPLSLAAALLADNLAAPGGR